MSNLGLRVLSAVAAISLLFGAIAAFGVTGLKALVFLVVFVGNLELAKILFPPEKSPSIFFRLFPIFSFCVFCSLALIPESGVLVFAFASVLISALILHLGHANWPPNEISFLISRSILGVFYAAVLPYCAYSILSLEDGINWFLGFLLIVFSGDIGGYFGGLLFGKTPLMPEFSPKKTWEGAICGLILSSLSGAVLAGWLGTPLLPMISLAVASGAVGQMGDMFESLLKRVASVKDSGKMLPGHGGVLDRIDAVIFASPVFLTGAALLQSL
ncbi:MAG: phosphatidate cytidylyltransferase [Bdellovibrionaceae bacterium]|nr:phosphatidate cytidylyltransferase [Pseudobdellovibrionaceae bacterium]